MKSKRNSLGKLVKKIPIIGFKTHEILSSLLMAYKGYNNKKKWKKNKKQILQEASQLINENISLDVSIRDGLFVFHNKKNSLINRGNPYEPEVQIALKTLINFDKFRNNHVVFADIGANIGLHTLHIQKNFPDIEIIAFDPSPFSYKYLGLTINYNKIRNIRLEQVALSEEEAELEFYSWGENSSADSYKDTKRVTGETPIILKVSSVSLDSIKNLPPISVMKIDTEGAELRILKGAINTIKKYKPFIVLEFHKMNREAFEVETKHIFDFLMDIDYSILSLNFELLSAQQFDYYQDHYITEDYILLPKNFLKLFYK